MKPNKVLCSMFLFDFLALTVHKPQFCPIVETCRLRTNLTIMCERKQKIVHGRGPSNINLGIFVCFFEVYRPS